MYEVQNNLLPGFNRLKLIHQIRNTMQTRQANNVLTDLAQTNFFSLLPKHTFPKIWNECCPNIRTAKSKTIIKKQMNTNLLANYKSTVTCKNIRCRYCNPL